MNAAMDEFLDPSQPNLLDVFNKALRDRAIPAARVARVRAAVAAFARLMHRPADGTARPSGIRYPADAAIAPPADRPVPQDPVKHPVRAPLSRKDRLAVAGHGQPSPSRRLGRLRNALEARPRLVVAVAVRWLLVATERGAIGRQRRASRTLCRGLAAVGRSGGRRSATDDVSSGSGISWPPIILPCRSCR